MSEFAATPPLLETDYSFTGGETTHIFEHAPERVQNIALALRGKLTEILAPEVSESTVMLRSLTQYHHGLLHGKTQDEYFLVHAGKPLPRPDQMPVLRYGCKKYPLEDITDNERLTYSPNDLYRETMVRDAEHAYKVFMKEQFDAIAGAISYAEASYRRTLYPTFDNPAMWVPAVCISRSRHTTRPQELVDNKNFTWYYNLFPKNSGASEPSWVRGYLYNNTE